MLRALDAKAEGRGEPRREGKVVIFDEELSLNTRTRTADASMRLLVPA